MKRIVWIVLILIAGMLICVSLAIWPAAGFREEAVDRTAEAARAVVRSIALDRAEEARRLEELNRERLAREAAPPSVEQSPTAPPEGGASEDRLAPETFRVLGTVHYAGWKWTWYSERVLPGGGLDIPGRHTDGDGFVCDGDGYICLASTNAEDKRTGAVYMTPFGRYGKVYDFCDGVSEATLDVYVGW